MPRREWSVPQRQFLVEKKLQGICVAQIQAEYAQRWPAHTWGRVNAPPPTSRRSLNRLDFILRDPVWPGPHLDRGWYDGNSFAGKIFVRESPTPGMSDYGDPSPGVCLLRELARRGSDVSGAYFAGD